MFFGNSSAFIIFHYVCSNSRGKNEQLANTTTLVVVCQVEMMEKLKNRMEKRMIHTDQITHLDCFQPCGLGVDCNRCSTRSDSSGLNPNKRGSTDS